VHSLGQGRVLAGLGRKWGCVTRRIGSKNATIGRGMLADKEIEDRRDGTHRLAPSWHRSRAWDRPRVTIALLQEVWPWHKQKRKPL
jgi:hypothetical protein